MTLSLSDALLVTVTSLLIVFLVLVGLMLITMAFKYIFKEETETRELSVSSPASESERLPELPLNKDPKIVAALTALLVAVEEDQDKSYVVTSVERMT